MVATLEEYGIDIVFGMDDPQGFYNGLSRSSIHPVIVHDERSGIFMADAYARATGRVAFCAGITGPGATNLATGLLEARCASVPVVALVGEANPAEPGLHAFQEAPHEQFLRPLTKGVVSVRRADDAAAGVRRAIETARSGRPRPVLLLTDDNLLWEVVDESDGDAPSSDRRTSAYPAHRPRADQRAVRQSIELLASARRPVILAGGGVLVSDAYDSLRRVAENYQVPVATSPMGKGAIQDSHPLAVGVGSSYTGGRHGLGSLTNSLLCDADVLLVVGCDLDPVATSSGTFPRPGTQVVRIDIDHEEVAGDAGVVLVGDAREVLQQLLETAPSIERDGEYSSWLIGVQRDVEARRAALREDDFRKDDDGFVSPGAVAQLLNDHLAEGDSVVTDASYCSAWVADRLYVPFAGRTFFAPRGSGVLGWGLPAALAVKLARPDGHVTCVTGDGGLCYSLGELETAIREGIDVTLIVLNNSQLGFQRHSDILHQHRDPGLQFAQVDYVRLAEAFGWRAVRTTSLDDFASAYVSGRKHDQPTLIEVTVHENSRPPITKFDELTDREMTPSVAAA